jgi:hypothetical protein
MGDNRDVMAAARTFKPDTVGVQAVDVAREALLALVDSADVGEHLGFASEEERVTTHYFACTRAGYRGWRWSVTVVRAARHKRVTVDEIVLLPGDGALVAPPWVPWRERIQPGDLGPGDLLPVEEDDPRLVPAFLSDEEGVDSDLARSVADELAVGRSRVLSFEGREIAAQRWYDGSHGPESPIAQSAPAACDSCGFLVRMAGPLSQLFGVCANAYANDDGRVVSFDHGCGAHSEARLHKRNLPAPLPEPVLDTLTWDDLEQF